MIKRMKPAMWWLAFVPVFLVLGVGGGVAWLVHALLSAEGETVQFVGPGNVMVQVDQPGTYLFWHDARADYGDRAFDNPLQLPEGMTLSMIHAESGEETVIRPGRGLPEKSRGHVRCAVGRCRIERPGDYRIAVSGGDGQRLFSFGPSLTGSLVTAVVACGVLNLVGWGGALAIVILVTAERTRIQRLRRDEDAA